ncbi:MAG: amidohydrolase family protein [Candidatus Sedimenticola sp. 6PFRAG7]
MSRERGVTLFAILTLMVGLNLYAEPGEIITSPGFEVKSQLSDPGRPSRSATGKYAGPIVDTHVHLLKGLKHSGISAINKEMEKSGVTRMIVLPTPNEGLYRDRGDNAAKRRSIAGSDGKRFQRLCGSTYLTRWMHSAYRTGFDESDLQSKLYRLQQDLERGGCVGIGEIGPFHFLKKPGQEIIEFPLTFKPMLDLVGFAAGQGAWLDLHVEPIDHKGRSYEEEIFGAIAYWYSKHPNLKLILSHTGMTNPHNARELLKRYPNLMMNFKHVRYGISLNWDNLERIQDRNDRIYEDWAQLFEAMPERFMVGTDARFGIRRFSGKRYRKIVTAIRSILGGIDPTAAEMIGYRNAERVFGRL